MIGERWTLLVLREAFLGVRRFEQLQRHTGMARNILSDRLNTLVAHGILRRELYQERPQRYEYRLTERGLDLYPVLLSLMDWGARHLDGQAMTLHAQELRRDRDAAPRLPRVRRAGGGAGHARGAHRRGAARSPPSRPASPSRG